MNQTLIIIRIFFFTVFVLGGYLVAYAVPEWDDSRGVAVAFSACIGALVILVDVLLKGFSLRGLSALTFGLFVGWLVATFLSNSPLFENGDPQTLFVSRLALFVICAYLGAVLALRGKDEFSLVIPYVRFVPHQVESPLAVVDTSVLIDGRIVSVCESKFLGYGLVIPTFVIDELHLIADSRDPQRQARGRRGLDVLNQLRRMPHLHIHIHESDAGGNDKLDAKLIYVARSLKAKVLTTDYNLAQVAKFHNVDWLNLNVLAKALRPEVITGEQVEVTLVKEGREPGQAVGYLPDGSMVVVAAARHHIGATVVAEVENVLPSAGGKMVFATILEIVSPAPGKRS